MAALRLAAWDDEEIVTYESETAERRAQLYPEIYESSRASADLDSADRLRFGAHRVGDY